MPQFGDTVSFPDFVHVFGQANCESPSDTQCTRGTLLSLQGDKQEDGTYDNFEFQAAAIVFPANGVISFDSDGEITLSQELVSSKATWKDRGDIHRDFQCADNWVVAGTSENPNFGQPCFNDFADFSVVRSFAWSV